MTQTRRYNKVGTSRKKSPAVLIREEEEEEEGGEHGEDEEQRVCLCRGGGGQSVLQPSAWEGLMDGGGGKDDGRFPLRVKRWQGALGAGRPASARPAVW